LNRLAQFAVIDPWGEQLVHTYPTLDAARQDIEFCKQEEALWETAKLLVDVAIKAHMQIHEVDRETAAYWINSALGGT
jgi:S-adenosylmethionine/arginine decarboxylase-like enzyme